MTLIPCSSLAKGTPRMCSTGPCALAWHNDVCRCDFLRSAEALRVSRSKNDRSFVTKRAVTARGWHKSECKCERLWEAAKDTGRNYNGFAVTDCVSVATASVRHWGRFFLPLSVLQTNSFLFGTRFCFLTRTCRKSYARHGLRKIHSKIMEDFFLSTHTHTHTLTISLTDVCFGVLFFREGIIDHACIAGPIM